MENSILISTKKILGIGAQYTAFDPDIITHINSVFAIVNQIGIGPENVFTVTSDEETWEDFKVPQNQLNLLKTYVFLKVRLLFDPPTLSFLIDAMNKQVEEYEQRLSYLREGYFTSKP